MENHLIDYSPTDSSNYTLFNHIILKAAAETNTKPKSSYKGWFQFYRSTLLPAITHRDQLLHTLRAVTSIDLLMINKALTTAQNIVSNTISIAKATCSSYQANIIHAIKLILKDAWTAIKILVGGKEIHHDNPVVMRMRLPNGKLSTTDDENASTLAPHFGQVYTAHRPISRDALYNIHQRYILFQIDEPI